jgi:hypothetical protein
MSKPIGTSINCPGCNYVLTFFEGTIPETVLCPVCRRAVPAKETLETFKLWSEGQYDSENPIADFDLIE